jgi:hypothetical protein
MVAPTRCGSWTGASSTTWGGLSKVPPSRSATDVGQPSFSYPARTREGQKADLSTFEQAGDLLHVSFAANQARRLASQISCFRGFRRKLCGQIAHALQRRAVGGTKVERRAQLLQCALPRHTPTATVQCRDTLSTQSSALGELVLRQSGGYAPFAHQVAFPWGPRISQVPQRSRTHTRTRTHAREYPTRRTNLR